MKDGLDYRIGPGMTSLLMIFFVLCMAALAILTLQSVQVESALNARTANTTGAYYEAATQAERQLADIDARLVAARIVAGGNPDVYTANVAALQSMLWLTHAPEGMDNDSFPPSVSDSMLPLTFAVPIGASGESEIQVILHVPQTFTGPRYTVVRRMVVNITSWDGEQDIGMYVPGTSD